MKKRIIEKKEYIITASLVLGVFLVLFISKGIFPFGKNSLIWGDMHDQITAFYYHFYDSFRGNASLLIDFTTSGGVNFFGILSYYILSPITFLLLFFPREQIYLAVSIVIAIKILLSSLTCLYFIRYYFKKLPSALSVFLSICYAFSGYSLSMYQITPWMDIMYLFPLLMIGFKKVLDLEKPTWYIILLTASFICCFYISIMLVIFIFLSAFIYLLVYKEKEDRKKGIVALGISTILSLLMSLFVLVPSYMQISVSSRLNMSLAELINSKAGPLTDKLSFFMFGGIVYLGILLLIKNHKKDCKFLLWYIATCLIVAIPIVIEPINKVWHLGSYAFFPYRFGFIMIFLLIIGACQGFNLEKEPSKKEIKNKKEKIFLVGLTAIICSIIIPYLTHKKYNIFQIVLDGLTLSKNHRLLIFLALTTFLAILACVLIYRWTTAWSKTRILGIAVVTLVHITCNSFLYLGIDFSQDRLMGQYETLLEISKTHEKGDYYRVKNMASNLIMNNGMVMKYPTLDHFTSLTDRNNLQSLKKLGYSSMWVKTSSKGGTMFSDALLGTRYIISEDSLKNDYYQFVGQYGDLKFYKLQEKPSYGHFIHKNGEILNQENSFEIQNMIYQSITDTKDQMFSIHNTWDFNNIKEEKQGEKTAYHIIDEKAFNSIEQTIDVKNKQNVYLEILKDLDNSINSDIYEGFNIYINDHLFKEHALEEMNNGLIDLGIFENEEVNIKIELRYDMELDNITLATMDLEKYESFIESFNVPLEIKFEKNKIHGKVQSEEKQMLFLPISYNEGYEGKVNQNKVKIEKIFGNFIGIPLEKGNNDIQITFVPPGLKLAGLVSLLTLFFTILMFKKNWYFSIINSKVIQTIAHTLYLFAYTVLIVGVYIGLTIIFIISYFTYLPV